MELWKDLTRKTTITPRPPPYTPPLMSQLRRVFFMTFLMFTIGGMGRTAYLFYKDRVTEEQGFEEFLKESGGRVDRHGNPIAGKSYKESVSVLEGGSK